MQFLVSTLAALTLVTSALAVPLTSTPAQPASINTTTEYHLRTQVKSGQAAEKEKYNGLYLYASHTGAGLNDALFSSNQSYAIKGFLNETNITVGDQTFYNQEFDLGGGFPYGLSTVVYNSYVAWGSDQINAGYGDGGYFINSTGLQYYPYAKYATTNSPGLFQGWLVCDWNHGTPQLFTKLNYLNPPKLPSSCAEVYLMPEYI